MILMLLFIQLIPTEKGVVFYKNSRVFFKTLELKTYSVQSWDILKTPTDQVIEVSYELKKNQLHDLKMTESFREIYRHTNRTMKAAEKLLKQRHFRESLDSLLIVQESNPFLPYLYSNLLYVQSQLNMDTDVLLLIESFEKKQVFFTDLEQSIFYYGLYDHWRDRFDKNADIKNLDKALKSLEESYTLKRDNDKFRLLNTLKTKIEALQNDPK